MASVVPTITAESPNDYAHQLDQVKPFAKRLHIDVADGVFVDRKLLSLTQVYDIPGLPFDLHLMINHPEKQLENVISLHPQLVIIHYEAKGDHDGFVNQLHRVGIKAGLAINPETTIKEVAKLLPKFEHVLVFTGGHIGYFGGQFRSDCLGKIKQAKAVNPKLEVAVDGGVDPQTALEAVDAGADVLDCGSYIHDSADPEEAFHNLEAIATVAA